MTDEDNRRPLPREVYIRRRIAAVVILVVVIGVIWALISLVSGGGDSENTASTESAITTSEQQDMTSSPEPPKGTEPSESKDEKASEEKSEDKSKDSENKEEKKDSCSLADLQVTARPGAPTFNAEQQPNFFVKIENPTNADCDINFDDSPLKFEVFTMGNYERVWGDIDCNEPEVVGDTKIKAGESVNYEMAAWSRTTSAPGKCEDRKPVDPGSYLLYAHVGDNTSQPASFNLQ